MTVPSAEEWRAFADGGPVPEGLPPEVAESWERCRAAGADPERATIPQVSQDDLSAGLEAKGPLLTMTSPALDALSRALQGSCVVVAVVDLRGCVLKTWGEVPPDAPGLLPHLRSGLLLREPLTGTAKKGGFALLDLTLKPVYTPDVYIWGSRRVPIHEG